MSHYFAKYKGEQNKDIHKVQLSSSKESSGSEPTKASGFPFGKPLQSSKEIKKQELVHQAEFISI